MVTIDLTQEQAVAMERSVADHMELCWEYLAWLENNEPDEEVPYIFNEVDMFCGCDTCINREFFTATFNYLRNANIVDVAVV